MKEEEDDMLELLDDEDLLAESAEHAAAEHIDSTYESSEDSPDDTLELDESDDITPATANTDESSDESVDDELELDESDEEEPEISIDQGSEPPEEEQPEKEGIEIDIRLLIVAAVAIAVILIAAVFFVMPMFSDKAPDVTINPSQTGEDLFLYHAGGSPLTQEHLRVQINGALVSPDKYMLMGGGTWPWTSGTVLKVDTSGYVKPATVTLLYVPKSTEYTVFTTTVQPTPTPTPTPEPVITPDQQPAGEGTPSEMPATQLKETPGVAGTPLVPVAPLNTVAPVVQSVTSGSIVMDVQPAAGAAPLTVQCNDLTSGCIRNRVWDFGDGQTTMKRNPVHIYPFPGTYNISLDVRFCDPEDDAVVPPVRQIVVAPSSRQDTLAQGTGKAEVLPGGKIFFVVKGPGTNVRIGGRDQYLQSGDHVELLLGSGGSGDISVVSQALLKCDYSNVTMVVNGEEVHNGTISVINIDKYLEFETADLTINVQAGRDGAKGLVGGQPVINAAPAQKITFSNVGLDSSGKLLLSFQNTAGFTFRGGVGSYDVSTPSSS
ncbi:MAG: PKD domain-containing protein [Methanospirillum sp.]|uniref:PKD domain-containing protein n=1 Tax=Methanospirillum sp. TaxID=45200 RepID=UPI002369C04F|nr:PKD domain-containing protein [Methanospirillum sp.]MDD1729029.1 PKD domain-containing protein [Methanospirillum sp.]